MQSNTINAILPMLSDTVSRVHLCSRPGADNTNAANATNTRQCIITPGQAAVSIVANIRAQRSVALHAGMSGRIVKYISP